MPSTTSQSFITINKCYRLSAVADAAAGAENCNLAVENESFPSHLETKNSPPFHSILFVIDMMYRWGSGYINVILNLGNI
jgi:hypothetical protein